MNAAEIRDEVVARVERELRPAILEAADRALDVLGESDVVRVRLAPGDSTVYDMILARPATIGHGGGLTANKGRAWVTLLNLVGGPRTGEIESYVVEGRGAVDYLWVASALLGRDYGEELRVPDYHTTQVLSVFLTKVFGTA